MIYIVSKYSVSGTSLIKWPFKKDLGTLNTHSLYDLKRIWVYPIFFYQRTKYAYQEVVLIDW